jgi:hypothetical protein
MSNFPGRGLPPQRPIRSDFITYKDVGMSQSSHGHMPMQELSKPTTRFPSTQSLPLQRPQPARSQPDSIRYTPEELARMQAGADQIVQHVRAAQHFNHPHPGFQEEIRRGQQVVEQIVPKFPPPISPPPPAPDRKEPPVNPAYNQAPPVQQVSEADIQEIYEFGKAEGKLEAIAEVRAALLELINTMDFIAKEVEETVRPTPEERVPPEYTYDAYSPADPQAYYDDTDHYNSQEGYYEQEQEQEMNYPSEDLYTFNPADIMPAAPSGNTVTQIRGMVSSRNPQDIMVSVISQMMASQPQFHNPFPGVH